MANAGALPDAIYSRSNMKLSAKFDHFGMIELFYTEEVQVTLGSNFANLRANESIRVECLVKVASDAFPCCTEDAGASGTFCQPAGGIVRLAFDIVKSDSALCSEGTDLDVALPLKSELVVCSPPPPRGAGESTTYGPLDSSTGLHRMIVVR
jgi:hypothetical protein